MGYTFRYSDLFPPLKHFKNALSLCMGGYEKNKLSG